MKKIIFLYISFSLITIQSLVGFTESISCIKNNEKELRHMLYKSYIRDKTFYTKKCTSFSHSFDEEKDSLCSCELFSNIDFFIIILEDHIKKLERKILKSKGFFQSRYACEGLFFLSLGTLSSVLSLFFPNYPWPKKEDYMEEKITDFQKALKFVKEHPSYYGSKEFIDEYSKSKFEQKFKDSSECFKKNIYQWDQCFKNLEKKSKSDFEKRFISIDIYHSAKHSSDEFNYLLQAIGFPLVACCCLTIALFKFSKFYIFERHYKKSLERNKELLAILKAEKCKM